MSLLNNLRSFLALFRLKFADAVVSLLQVNDYRLDKFVASFWQTADFSKMEIQPDASRFAARNQFLRTFIIVGGLAQLVFGAILIGAGANGQLVGGVYFGVALVISYPLVWAHLVLLAALAVRVPGWPKTLGKQIVLAILAKQVNQLHSRHNFKIIAVAGSAGKTSTKFMIAQTLETKLKVRWQHGNYNDIVSVPLVIFGQEMPSLLNVPAWLDIFRQNQRQINQTFDCDVVVLELGTDGPGQIAEFAKYIKVDIGVLTAIAPEHMEFFGNLDNVASEELALASFSKKLLVNNDLCASEYLVGLKKFGTYGFEKADWQLSNIKFTNMKHSFELEKAGKKQFSSSVKLLGRNQLYGIAAASAVASELGLTASEIKAAVAELEPVNGRLKPLAGIKNSTILDDSYNSAPEAVLAALETLYKIKAPQKIAILGSMNELGNYSAEAHQLVGEACDPKKLDLLVTIGNDASEFLASSASARGCNVKSFADPTSAGNYVKKQLKSKSLVLVKGSQNGVFAEEATKILLKNKSDASQLVRQSDSWLAIKNKQFGTSL